MQNNPKLNIFFSILIIIVAGLGIWFVLARTSAPAPIEIPESDTTQTSADTFTFKNVDLGFEFKYPSKYGAIDMAVQPGDTGKMFRAVAKEGNIYFGGDTVDFTQGRDGEIFDFNGDSKKLADIKQNAGSLYTYQDFETDSGVKGVKVEYIAVDEMNDFTPPPGTVVYYFQLHAMFSGVVFAFDKTTIPEYEAIMKTFNIVGSTTSQPEPTPTAKQCIKSGCSGQICSDHEELSTCEYRQEYACYETAKCEVQATTGECGWTETTALTQCLSKAQ